MEVAQLLQGAWTVQQVEEQDLPEGVRLLWWRRHQLEAVEEVVLPPQPWKGAVDLQHNNAARYCLPAVAVAVEGRRQDWTTVHTTVRCYRQKALVGADFGVL